MIYRWSATRGLLLMFKLLIVVGLRGETRAGLGSERVEERVFIAGESS